MGETHPADFVDAKMSRTRSKYEQYTTDPSASKKKD